MALGIAGNPNNLISLLMFNFNIKISLRSKLMVMSISDLIIPYIGFDIIRQTETYLRSTLESTVKKDSQVVASILNNKPRLSFPIPAGKV